MVHTSSGRESYKSFGIKGNPEAEVLLLRAKISLVGVVELASDVGYSDLILVVLDLLQECIHQGSWPLPLIHLLKLSLQSYELIDINVGIPFGHQFQGIQLIPAGLCNIS